VLLIALAVFLRHSAQLFSILTVTNLLFLLFHVYCSPFTEMADNHRESLSLIVLTLSTSLLSNAPLPLPLDYAIPLSLLVILTIFGLLFSIIKQKVAGKLCFKYCCPASTSSSSSSPVKPITTGPSPHDEIALTSLRGISRNDNDSLSVSSPELNSSPYPDPSASSSSTAPLPPQQQVFFKRNSKLKEATIVDPQEVFVPSVAVALGSSNKPIENEPLSNPELIAPLSSSPLAVASVPLEVSELRASSNV
jgi:hypothetical protein